MKLRKQLLLASLFTLSFPWVGCQYIQELETALQEGQDRALLATTNAVKATLESNSELLDELETFDHSATLTGVYFHTFTQPLTLDGYNEEWLSAYHPPQTFSDRTGNNAAEVYAAKFSDKLQVFLKVPSDEIHYYIPSQAPDKADHITLQCQDNSGEVRQYIIVASGPGHAKVLTPHQNGWLISHEIKALWIESASGYHVEIQIPASRAASGFNFHAINAQKKVIYSNSSHVISTQRLDQILAPLIHRSTRLERVLRTFESAGIRLQLASKNNMLIASTGTFDQRQKNTPWLLTWIYGIATNQSTFDALPSTIQLGYFPTLPAHGANHHKQNFSHNGTGLSRMSVPINNNATPIARIIAEQTAHRLQHLTSSAFTQLLSYTLVLVAVAILVLLSYASWLSFRIGKLNRSTASAISESGNITQSFVPSKAKDEIGELARSFAHLLEQQREYTLYLRTLANKLSHELRTPLAIVSSSLDNLDHQPLPKASRVFAERAREGSDRLSKILNAMSAASRIEQAIQSAELHTFNVCELLKGLIESYQDIYKSAQFQLKFFENACGSEIRGAPELLVQMFDKLIDNAAGFCPDGGNIFVHVNRSKDNAIHIIVYNDGPPLPDHMQSQLFDSMVSVRNPADKDSEHLGLGLYIVKLVVAFHNGKVTARNAKNNAGVEFIISIPCLTKANS